MNVIKYIKIWSIFTMRTTQIAFTSRVGVVIFSFGKILRFSMYILFLLLLVSKTNSLAGYSLWHVLLFFSTYSFIDTCAQFLLREVYRFRSHVVSGYFDQFLLWPLSPLFKSLFGGSDVLDVPLVILSMCFMVFSSLHVPFPEMGIIFYCLLLLNAFLLALAFHIVVLSLGILTTEVDNTLWIYRDLTQMGRVPVDIYQEPVKSIITFVFPVGIMMTFPVKAFLGLLSLQVIIISFIIGISSFSVSLLFWKYALKKYSSASS